MDIRQKIIIILMDAMLLLELTFSLYLSHSMGEEMTRTFLVLFLPMAAATVVASRILIKRMVTVRDMGS